MTDEENRQISFSLDADQQLHNGFLYGNIQCTCCLVTDQNLRLQCQCTCNPDSLTLPPTHICRIAFGKFLRQIDETEQFCCLVPCTPLEESEVAQRFTDDVLDLHLWIKRCRRILKHHLDIAPHITRFFPTKSRDFLVLKKDLPFRWCMKLHQCAHQRTLSAAALTNNAENISPIDGERHVIACRKYLTALQREALRDVIDAQDNLTLRCCHNALLQSVVRHAGVPWYTPAVRAR